MRLIRKISWFKILRGMFCTKTDGGQSRPQIQVDNYTAALQYIDIINFMLIPHSNKMAYLRV